MKIKNLLLLVLAAWAPICPGAVYNLKIVTDGSPDYSDMESMIYSITSNWSTTEEKCWAMFYWNHIGRRQTSPMILHGMALTDPIRQFNDYGYTMCSTISGINCSIWDAMGLKAKYWDISNHTVAEVQYGDGWHMYDNSLSALYTLCDGRTLAGVEDIGKTGSCAASGGKAEPGHIARYHCRTSTSANGFLSGADTIRSLDEEYRCFNPNGLKYRSYFYDWDRGHRYILNLRRNESYTRYYYSLGKSAEFYVPNGGKDPEAANTRYHLRGNGIRAFKPLVDPEGWQTTAHSHANVTVSKERGLTPIKAGESGEVIFKIEGANVITALEIKGRVFRKTSADAVSIDVSTSNGLSWTNVWKSNQSGEQEIELKLIEAVNGSYEVLLKVAMMAQSGPADISLRALDCRTTTMLNSKTQPRLQLGKNTIEVGAGDQSESIVVWPDLQKDQYQRLIVDEQNMTSAKRHPGYMGAMHAVKPREPAHVVFKVDAPREISRAVYGGRLYNRAPRSKISFLHSFDGGKSWQLSYTLTNTAQPWDVIHYETVTNIPPGTRSVLFKYQLESTSAGSDACSIYAVRMEVNHRPADLAFEPIDVTFNWSERQEDYSLVERSHAERIEKLPHRYVINVGGADHPIVNWMRVKARGAAPEEGPGYSDGRDVGGEKFISKWVTYGKNLALGKPYSVSVPSSTQWGAGDPNGTKLTDGVVGPPYAGGTAPASALSWNQGQHPQVTIDLGKEQQCGAFQIHLGAGWPWWDALKGQFKDKVEVLSSLDGTTYRTQGFVNSNLRWKDLPANHVWPDEEVIAGHNFELIPETPLKARYVRFKITPERALTVSEVTVLDSIQYRPFDLRIALPSPPSR